MTDEDRKTVQMAIGRLFSLMMRPEQPGDADQYHECRRVILDTCPDAGPDYRPCYVRDRNRGASGD